jgi:hypothetical protein
MHITVTSDDGGTTDVTEAVQVIYDAMHAYMGMASGSLDAEEWDAVLRLAEAAQFSDYESLLKMREEEREEERRREETRQKYRQEHEERLKAAQAHVVEQVRIADEMRAAEPQLAAYTVAELYTLHLMRKNGQA